MSLSKRGRRRKIPQIDFSVFTVQDVRAALKLKAKFIKSGLPLTNPLYLAIKAVRDGYTDQRTFKQYINEMLGELGESFCGDCSFFSEDGGKIFIYKSRGKTEAVRDLLGRQPGGIGQLPFVVRCGEKERYL